MASWHEDPLLQGRFHPDAPDDIQILVHDGSPRVSSRAAELVWARVINSQPDHYVAVCLNQPRAIESVAEGSQFRFRVTAAAEFPFLVGEQYLTDRVAWEVAPCIECGFDELFDAPSELAASMTPGAADSEGVELMSRFCPLCDGVQMVYLRALRLEFERDEEQDSLRARRRWWRRRS